MSTSAPINAEPELIVEAGRSVGHKCPACGGTKTVPFVQARDWLFLRQPLYQIHRCEQCHLGWLQDPPAVEKMGLHYGADYDKMITTPGDLYPHHWDLVRSKLLQYVERGSILDIGCSSGSFLRTLKGPDWKLYGIEMSAPVAEQARKSAGAEVFIGDVLQASFACNQFDAVTGFHILEHMHDPLEVMSRVFTWLKPGGIFTLTLPNSDSLEARIFRAYWFGLDVPRHLWQFSSRSLAAMAGAVGFDSLEVGTTRSCYLEGSTRNLLAGIKLGFGIRLAPPSEARPRGLIAELVRKAFRLLMVYPFRELAVVLGKGADLHAVFRKPL